MSSAIALEYFYHHAADQVRLGNIQLGENAFQLKHLQDQGDFPAFLRSVRNYQGYNTIIFPHCLCDSRKDGHVMPSVSHLYFRLQACTPSGILEAQTIDFAWTDIKSYEVTDDRNPTDGAEGGGGQRAQGTPVFSFEYSRPNKRPRWVRLHTPFYHFLYDCFEKILEELTWCLQGNPNDASRATSSAPATPMTTGAIGDGVIGDASSPGATQSSETDGQPALIAPSSTSSSSIGNNSLLPKSATTNEIAGY